MLFTKVAVGFLVVDWLLSMVASRRAETDPELTKRLAAAWRSEEHLAGMCCREWRDREGLVARGLLVTLLIKAAPVLTFPDGTEVTGQRAWELWDLGRTPSPDEQQ